MCPSRSLIRVAVLLGPWERLERRERGLLHGIICLQGHERAVSLEQRPGRAFLRRDAPAVDRALADRESKRRAAQPIPAPGCSHAEKGAEWLSGALIDVGQSLGRT